MLPIRIWTSTKAGFAGSVRGTTTRSGWDVWANPATAANATSAIPIMVPFLFMDFSFSCSEYPTSAAARFFVSFKARAP